MIGLVSEALKRSSFSVLWCLVFVSSTQVQLSWAQEGMNEQGKSEQVKADATSRWLDASIEDLQDSMTAGDLSAQKLVQFYLARIEQYDQQSPSLNAVQTLNSQALSEAAALDSERAEQGPRSLLHGIVVLVKDNYETVGMSTTAGSIVFEGFAPDRDAHLVAQLKTAGAIILGKTTMHEFAYGITTVGSRFGATKNPYDLGRNPGGSSGGSGAAVAANFATLAMGSDTCGSIRIPAAHNNLVGLRGTQGLSSRRGIVPLSSTQDIGGPLARSVRDLAIVLDVVAGYDPGDAQTAESFGQLPEHYLDAVQVQRGARIGVLRDWLVQDAQDEDVAKVIREALAHLHEHADWQVIEIESPRVNEALQRPMNGHFVLIYDFKTDINAYLQANPEIGIADIDALLADGRSHADILPSLQASAGMTEESEITYLEELAQRRVVRQALLALMNTHNLDALAYPTIRRVAAPIGEEQLGTNCRLSANSGLPAISVPAGFAGGMPVGLELLAESWSEPKLLNLAYTVEQLLAQRRPPAATP